MPELPEEAVKAAARALFNLCDEPDYGSDSTNWFEPAQFALEGAAPAIRRQRDEELGERLEKLSAEWERQAESLRRPHSPSRQVNVNRRERAKVCDEKARHLREVARSIFEENPDA